LVVILGIVVLLQLAIRDDAMVVRFDE